jgi:hypothetical protein
MKSSKLKVKSFNLFRSLFTVHCSLFVLCILCLVSVSNADAAYKIYLKNGSVIKGVSHYEKTGGEIKFYFEGGTVGIPETDILRIETGREPLNEEKTKPSVTEKSVEPPKVELPEEKPAEMPDVKKQADDGDKKSDEITRKEAELKSIEEDLQRTNIRVQNLFMRSTQGTITTPERSMLQQNMVKKRKLEDDKKRVEEELKALREGKEPSAVEKKEPSKPQESPYGKPPGSYSY